MKEAFTNHGHISAFILYYLTLKRLFSFTSLHTMYEHLTWNKHLKLNSIQIGLIDVL